MEWVSSAGAGPTRAITTVVTAGSLLLTPITVPVAGLAMVVDQRCLSTMKRLPSLCRPS